MCCSPAGAQTCEVVTPPNREAVFDPIPRQVVRGDRRQSIAIWTVISMLRRLSYGTTSRGSRDGAG